jgi:renal tumor antigen
MDVWGAGCVLFEIMSLFPLFPGADEVDQVNRIHKVVGTPSREILLKLRKHKSTKIDFKFREQKAVGIRHFIPHAPVECVHLIEQTLIYDYSERILSPRACDHKYFDKIRDRHQKAINRKATSAQSQNIVENRNEESSFHRKSIVTPSNEEATVGSKTVGSRQKSKNVVRVEGGMETRSLVKVRFGKTNSS